MRDLGTGRLQHPRDAARADDQDDRDQQEQRDQGPGAADVLQREGLAEGDQEGRDDRAAQQLALHHCENAGQTLVARVSSLAEPDKQHA